MLSLFPVYSLNACPRTFFLDMNAFYTSVEQQECAAYRGRPTIVVPVLTDTTCAIAASYEAKALGIKTGISVGLARIACPTLQIVEARPQLYLDYHVRLLQILNQHFVTVKALSVDEMACRVPSLYKSAREEERLALRVKQQIYQQLGPCLRCSIGIGPNVFLAKVASDRQKPEGLTIFNEDNLPDALFDLKLSDLPGIGAAMKRRLWNHGITTVQALWEASPSDLRRAWGSVLGERWHYMLRGSQEADYQPAQAHGQAKKSVGHSNVLAPQHRTWQEAQRILLELFAKALKRLRAYDQAASAVQVTVRYRKLRGAEHAVLNAFTEGVWTRRSRKHLHANDDATWLKTLRPLLEAMPDLHPAAEPSYVAIVFSELLACRDVNLSLFDDPQESRHLAQVIDDLNRRYDHAVGLASTYAHQDQVPVRIPYGTPEPSLSSKENAASVQ